MARIQVETTQNVLLEFDLAGVGDRLIAAFIDFIIGAFYIFVVDTILDVELLEISTVSIIKHIIMIGPYFFYELYMEYFLNGQTLGKKIMNIKVMKLDGAAPSFGDYLMRWMLRIIDRLLIGIIVMAVSKYEQRLGDMAADTTVIRLRKRANLEDTVLKLITNKAYQPVFTSVLQFSDKDINLIKETVDYAKRTGQLEKVVKLSKRVRELSPEIPHMSPLKTLETLIYDYNFLAQKINP